MARSSNWHYTIKIIIITACRTGDYTNRHSELIIQDAFAQFERSEKAGESDGKIRQSIRTNLIVRSLNLITYHLSSNLTVPYPDFIHYR